MRIILGMLLLAHTGLTTSTAWGDSFTIKESTALCDVDWLYKFSPLRNYGKGTKTLVGDTYIPQTRTERTISRFNTLPDSMRDVGTATWDSARIGFVIKTVPAGDDSVCITAHKVTTPGWLEGEGTGQDTCGVSWDSANATGYTDCAGSPLDWTADGGDFSATRETYGNHVDSLWIFDADYDNGDTVFFHISSATVSDTMGNKGGIIIQHIELRDTDSNNSCYVEFHTDDAATAAQRTFLQVWYMPGAAPTAAQFISIGGQ